MLKQYNLPDNLKSEINELSKIINDFKNGKIAHASFKTKRVTFGVYEQREPNTYMIRIRLPGGVIDPEQLSGIASISKRFGANNIALTTRQAIQIHNFKLDDLINIVEELYNLSLSSRGGGGNTVRNIIFPADSGVDPDELFDVTPYGLALTSRLIAEPDSWKLPRKFKIAFSGNPKKGYAQMADIGYVAKIKDNIKGFRVFVGGSLGAQSALSKLLFDFVPANDVYYIAKALKNVFYKWGNRKNKYKARLKFLINKIGWTDFSDKVTDELNKVRLEHKHLDLPKLSYTKLKNNSPLTNKNDNKYEEWLNSYTVRIKKDYYNVQIPIYLGLLNTNLAIKLGDYLKNLSEDVLRIDEYQNLLLRSIPQSLLADIYNLLSSELDLSTNQLIYSKVVSCTGAATCKLGVCFSRELVKEITNKLERSKQNIKTLKTLNIKLSGCPNNCGQHSIADLGFFGRVGRNDSGLYPVYSILVKPNNGGDVNLAKNIGNIPAKGIPDFILTLLDGYNKLKNKPKDFKTYIANLEYDKLLALLDKHSNVGSFDDNPNAYYDWGSGDRFSLVGKGEAECSAGLLDLVNHDFQSVERLRVRLKSSANHSMNLRKILFHSLRAMVITQKFEPKDDEVIPKFKELFVDQNIILDKYKPLIFFADKNPNKDDILNNKLNILEFASYLKDLYDNVDDHLRFKPIMAKEQTSKN